MNFGIELEFFVQDRHGKVVPAYEATQNLDGNPILGELRTGVHSNIIDCVYELKKLIHKEKLALEKKGFSMKIIPQIKVDKAFIKDVRKHIHNYKKEYSQLDERSIYPNGKMGKVLPINVFKASLQVSVSKNKKIYVKEAVERKVDGKYRTVPENCERDSSEIFDYVSVIQKLDKLFAENISEAKRVKGVYAIKTGTKGDRVEYRSLPNNINLNLLIDALNK